MRKAFTLIELIMVIVILGILAAVALPNYFNLVGRANTAAEAGVVGGVRAGIATSYANTLADPDVADAYPATLDSAAAGSASTANPFFGNVLSEPITSGWSKNAAGAYKGPDVNGPTYTYNNQTGAFR